MISLSAYDGFRIVLAGSIGRSVTGGQAWANLQYLLGLEALGAEVTYLEDAGDWSAVYQWSKESETYELDYPAAYVESSLREAGFDGDWIYRTTDKSAGMTFSALEEKLLAADLLIIRGVPFLSWRSEYDLPKKRAFIDVDPGFTQIRYGCGEAAFVTTIDRCERLFTVGQLIGRPASRVPSCGRDWQPTLPPVFLPKWNDRPAGRDQPISTIMRWRGMNDLKHDGQRLGQKDLEVPRFADLPKRTGKPFLAALTGGGDGVFEKGGWQVVAGWDACSTPDSYRDFIAKSAAEFGIAKQCYVATSGGWFSDRSVCYLASGRPVIIQDTGHSEWLPPDRGVHWFSTPDEAAAAVDLVYGDLPREGAKGRALAEDLFASETVLSDLLRMV